MSNAANKEPVFETIEQLAFFFAGYIHSGFNSGLYDIEEWKKDPFPIIFNAVGLFVPSANDAIISNVGKVVNRILEFRYVKKD